MGGARPLGLAAADGPGGGRAIALTFPASALTFTELSAAGGLLGAGYLCWAVPLAAWIGMRLFAPQVCDALVARVRPVGARTSATRRLAANVAGP